MMGFSWEHLVGLYDLPRRKDDESLEAALKRESPERRARRQRVYTAIERATLGAVGWMHGQVVLADRNRS